MNTTENINEKKKIAVFSWNIIRHISVFKT